MGDVEGRDVSGTVTCVRCRTEVRTLSFFGETWRFRGMYGTRRDFRGVEWIGRRESGWINRSETRNVVDVEGMGRALILHV